MPSYFKRHGTRIIGVVFVILFALGSMYFVKEFLQSEPVHKKKAIQQITLVPPPPPPPPKEEPPPPPEPEIEEEVDVSEPEPDMEDLPEMADEQPPLGEELGLDAEGGAGSDAFGLIGKKGGRGLLGGRGDPLTRYASIVKRAIEDDLVNDDKLRKKGYSVVVSIWVANDGSVSRAMLVNSTGNEKTDQLLISRLNDLPPISEIPPDNLPLPIKIRISSRI